MGNEIDTVTEYNNNILTDIAKNNVALKKQYNKMVSTIQESLPQIESTIQNFGKTQSQFMDSFLTVSHPTPIRNIRQIMAEINKSMEALKESYYKNKKKEVEIKIKQRELEQETDDLKQEMLNIEIEEMSVQLETGKKYVAGAIRKITNYTEQYKSILKELGVDNINEVDFEKEEEEYHIKKAFEQGLNAARAHRGTIDEGNQIYLSQIGINGTLAQQLVTKYLNEEATRIANGEEVTAENQWQFLEEMYQRFKGSASKYAKKKGMLLTTDYALLGNNPNSSTEE